MFSRAALALESTEGMNMGTVLTQRHKIELVTIYEISKILNSSLDLQRTVRQVLSILSSHMDMRRGMISLVQPSGELHVFEASELSEAEKLRGRFRPGEGVVGRILQNGMPIVIPDVAQEPFFLNRTGARSLDGVSRIAFLGVPIKVGREAIGVLSIDREYGQSVVNFEADLRFLAMVANLIGQATRLYQNVISEREALLTQQRHLQRALQDKYCLDNVIGRSKRMQEVFAEVHQAAPSKATVLLRGESGTGKEVIARAIHYLSPRHEGPFIKVNCAALTETLLESELFGHEKGAFTGATQERKGRFELAHGGTLFLDELGEISPSFQTKLLRVLQEREFERVGGNRTLKVDVRLIAATNRNLEADVAKGLFRADLYYRINVITIFLPPLRERREDIPLLIEHFLARFNRDNGRSLRLAPAALEAMVRCNWPGNVRELENCVERVATMARGERIELDDVPCRHDRCLSRMLQRNFAGRMPEKPAAQAWPEDLPVELPIAPAELEPDSAAALPGERERLLRAMEQCGWVQAKAARMLNLTPRQIGYALRKYGIPIKRL